MPVKRDSKGRRKRRIRSRVHPLTYFRKDEFVARYRLSKRLVRSTARKYRPYASTYGSTKGGGLSHVDRFCLALRYFSVGGLYKTCGDTQHVSKALVGRCVADVSDYFYRHAEEYIKWPSSFEEKVEKSVEFWKHKDAHTPNCIGMLDGTHIPILKPNKSQNESSYVNRKGWHSINTTVIYDLNRQIINVDARWPGSVNDAYSFNASLVGDSCKDGSMGDFFLLADSGYGLSQNVFVPYRNPTTGQERAYNKWHRSTRARVEQCIGLLKQRFRCLDSSGGYLFHHPVRAAKIIVACCCLHNICLQNGIPVTTHPSDPWFPRRRRLDQPDQRTQRQKKEAIRKFRDDYAKSFFSATPNVDPTL